LILGSPAIIGDSEEDDCANDFNYDLENQNQKEKISDSMLGWQLTLGRSGELSDPNYEKEVPRNHIPQLSSGQEVIQLTSLMIVFLRQFLASE
jgi:cellulose synthase A